VPVVSALLRGVLSGSPYLSGLILRKPERLLQTLAAVPEHELDALLARVQRACADLATSAEVMSELRSFKSQIALLVALADLGGVWPVEQVTRALTMAADVAVKAAVAFLFREAVAKGAWTDQDATPESRSGFIVLGMGKLGAYELNYSSDIDIVVFYDTSK